MKTLGSGGGAGLQLQAESRARTQHVLCSTPTRLGHRSQGRWLCMVRLGLMFIPDPRTTAVKGLILEAVKWDPGGGEVDPHRAKETWILSGPPKALAQPASSSPAGHRLHVMGTAGKLVFLPPVGPASLGSSGMLWSLSSPCTDIPGSPELVLPFPGIPQPPWPHTHPPRDPPGPPGRELETHFVNTTCCANVISHKKEQSKQPGWTGERLSPQVLLTAN